MEYDAKNQVVIKSVDGPENVFLIALHSFAHKMAADDLVFELRHTGSSVDLRQQQTP